MAEILVEKRFCCQYTKHSGVIQVFFSKLSGFMIHFPGISEWLNSGFIRESTGSFFPSSNLLCHKGGFAHGALFLSGNKSLSRCSPEMMMQRSIYFIFLYDWFSLFCTIRGRNIKFG